MAEANARDEVTSLKGLNSAEKLARKFDSLKSARGRLENQWKLNLAFYKGKQWSYIDRQGMVRTLATEEGEMPRYRVRVVSNQIISGSQSLLSKLTKTKPILAATPGSSSDHDIRAAQMAESLLEFWWQDFHLDDALEEALLWGIIAGQGYWKISWDEQAGKAIKFMLGPDGRPITDESMKEAFRAQLAAAGIPPQEKTIYLGDIRVEAMSPFDVYLDPSAKTFKDVKYAICIHSLDPDEIKTRWGVEVKPDSVPSAMDVSLPFDNSGVGNDKTVKQVFVMYVLPGPTMPKGRYVAWIKEPHQILVDQPWPYPTNQLPLVKFPGIRVPGSIYDSSVVEHAIPIQKEINKTVSQIIEYKNLTIKPRVWAPVGSLRQRVTNEPGAVYEFTPIAGLRPEIEKLPTMPPYVFDQLEDMGKRLRDIFHLTEVTEGTPPPNVEAGIAIDLLQEMSTDRLAPTIKLLESALGRAGQLMLSLAQHYYVEPRLLKIRGSGGSTQVQKFTQADIDGGISVMAEAGSGLPRTRAGRQARIQSYVEMGILRPDQAWKYLDIADMKSVARSFQSDEDQAFREHDKLIRGIPINPIAAMEAMQTVAQGINPDTGQSFQSVVEAQMYVEQQSLAPWPFENFGTHRETHRQFLTSVEYEGLPDDAKHRFLTHYNLTVQAERAAQPPPPQEPVKTSMQIKGTIGPTGAASVLSAAGVPNITPDVMSEPPLETVVLDQIDKPDVEEAGNDPLTQADIAAKDLENQMELQKHVQNQDHAEMSFHQEARHKEEQHQEKLRQMRKPKPSAKN